jgi:MFS family permease
MTIVIGILLAQLFNWLIAQPVPPGATAQQILLSWNGQAGWRWMFGVTAIPSALFFAAMLFVPESPRWLAKQGFGDRARRILSRIGGERYASPALAEIRATLSGNSERVNWRDLVAPDDGPRSDVRCWPGGVATMVWH